MIILRKKTRNKFVYHYSNGKKVTDKKIIEKINKLRIPPAYTDVKIFPNARKIMATGLDIAGRKQYIYNHEYVQQQENNKQCALINFSKTLPKIIKKMNKDLKKTDMSKDFVLALVLKILITCNFRVGNQKYRNKYKSYGISSIKNSHVHYKKDGGSYNITFIGKKGVLNACDIEDSELIKCIKLVKQQRSRAIKKHDNYFFKYNIKSQSTKNQLINANDINNYLKKFDKNITSKFFRTWRANILFLTALRSTISGVNLDIKKNRKKIIKDAIIHTSAQLHHTPAICKKSYLNSDIIKFIEETPDKFLLELNKHKDVSLVFISLLKKFCKVR